MENSAERSHFRSVYRIGNEHACGRKSLDGHVKDIRSTSHTMVLNRTTAGEVSLPMDEMANHCIIRIRTIPPNKREIISAINAFKHTKAPLALFLQSLHDLLSPFIRKFRECETFQQ